MRRLVSRTRMQSPFLKISLIGLTMSILLRNRYKKLFVFLKRFRDPEPDKVDLLCFSGRIENDLDIPPGILSGRPLIDDHVAYIIVSFSAFQNNVMVVILLEVAPHHVRGGPAPDRVRSSCRHRGKEEKREQHR